MIDAIKAFEGGSCSQLLAMVDGRSCSWVRFPAVYFALHHKREGWILVDTGYGGRFREATRSFPARLYRWATPVRESGTVASALGATSIRCEDIRHVIVTHFHGDHIGGLADFPHATIHFHENALRQLQALPSWRQIRGAFLASLVPKWLADRSAIIRSSCFTTSRSLGFGTYDLFSDHSIEAVSLPGHAPGQLGVLFHTRERPVLYAADAYWRNCQLAEGAEPMRIAMAFQWDAQAYRATIGTLREVWRRGDHVLIACHDDRTADRLNQLQPL